MKIFLTEAQVIELAYDALDMHYPDPDKVHDIAARMDMVYDEYLDMFEDVEEISLRKYKRDLNNTTSHKKTKGLLKKYIVSKADGTHTDPGAEYFVLRLDKNCGDKIHLAACRKAVLTYAEEIKEHLPVLAKDLNAKYGSKKTANINWVFWIEVRRRNWFKSFWTTRGANFREVIILGVCISIGLPWLQSSIEGRAAYNEVENIHKINENNLKSRFSFLIKRT